MAGHRKSFAAWPTTIARSCFSRQAMALLVLERTSDAIKLYEQCLARTHRVEQQRFAVNASLYVAYALRKDYSRASKALECLQRLAQESAWLNQRWARLWMAQLRQ